MTFFYVVKNDQNEDANIVVAFSFDERYNENSAYVCTKAYMDEEISRAKLSTDADYRPVLDPMPVHNYVKSRRRLTEFVS